MSNSDPLATLRAQIAGGAGNAPPTVVTSPGGTGGSAVAPQIPRFDQVEITGQHVFERLRYFENLVDALFAHIKVLSAQVMRTGTAPAALPDFPKLKSPAGDFDPAKR